jgi:hypothetical protein
MTMQINHCGTCTACCNIFAIAELPDKPAGKWCTHCAVGVGCKIYEQRPATCRMFECLWLISQKQADPRNRLPAELRPDKSKVVFSPTTNENVMAATTMPHSPDAWTHPRVTKLIDAMVRGGTAVVVGAPNATNRTLIDGEGAHPVRMTEPDENGMQFNIPEPKEQRA